MSLRNYLQIINRKAVAINGLYIFNKNRSLQRCCALVQNKIFLHTANETKFITKPDDELQEKKSIYVRDYFLRYLQDNPKYKNFIYTPDFSVTESSSEFLNLLKQYSENLEDETPLLNLREPQLTDLSFDELLYSTHLLLQCFKKKNNNELLLPLLRCLDNELMNRPMKPEDNFKFLYALRINSNIHLFQFYAKSLNNFVLKLKYLPYEQVVLTFFFTVKSRNTDVGNKFALSSKMFQFLPLLTIEEIAIILLGSSNLGLKFNFDDVIVRILKYIINIPDKLDSVLVRVLSECLAEQCTYRHKELIFEFQSKMIPQVHKLHPASLVYLLLLSGHQINISLAQCVMDNLEKKVSFCSANIIEKIMYICSHHNLRNENLINELIKEFDYMVENSKTINFQKSLLTFLIHLLDFQIYPEYLLKRTMGYDFICNLISEKKENLIYHWEFLNCSLKLEKPEYHFVVSDKGIESKLLKAKYCLNANLQRPKKTSTFCHVPYVLENSLKEIYGEDKVLWIAPLRHYPEIILMVLDDNLQPQIIPEEVKELENNKTKIITPIDDKNHWVILLPINEYNLAKDKDLNLPTQTRIRQFRKAGYKVLMVQLREFSIHKKQNTCNKYFSTLLEVLKK